ncbi:sporulation control protein Spo0M [Endozoicomonas sp. OPT23]|uniref:sporulation protein n=1 Tax=Endozoicomonas sp. OPT23 TaxID=2072845 RepID=UPI00129B6D34|nr:sporulation protein [Endozoicomonas sp. OPT23]MRI32431.1 sporulation control protein Spo0M [Endozoicomonas sp. OPT23]
MFKKLLASVGIGGAEVDTIVNSQQVQPGGVLSVTVVIKAGDAEQEVSGLQLNLMAQTKYQTDNGEAYRNQVLQSWSIEDKLVLKPGDRHEIPMELQLHSETPITHLPCRDNQSQVWLETGLEVDLAIDPSDTDPLVITPTPTMMNCLEAMERCGLRMVKADIEHGGLRGNGFQSTIGCYQELEYRPEGWLTTLNEVELSFVARPGVVHVLAEVDRAFRGDSYLSLSFVDGASVSDIKQQLKQTLGL